MIWAVSATATPRSSRNPTASVRTGTPAAAATSGSTVANSRGRAIAPSTTTAQPATTRRATT